MTVGLAWLLRHRHGARSSAAGPQRGTAKQNTEDISRLKKICVRIQISCLCSADFMQSSFLFVYVSNYLCIWFNDGQVYVQNYLVILVKRNVSDIEMSEVFVLRADFTWYVRDITGTADMGFSCASHWHRFHRSSRTQSRWTTRTLPVFSSPKTNWIWNGAGSVSQPIGPL